MPAFGEQYSEDQRWALAEYLRSLTFSSTLAQASVPETPAETQAAAYPYPVPVEAQATAYPYPAPEEAPTEEVLMDTTPVSATKVLGTVSGVVINASGGDLPPGLPVDLFAFDHVQVVYSATIELDKDGSYLFENVEMPDGLVFLTTIDFQGATYGSEIGTPEGGTYDIVLPLQVYESTTDVSVLQVDRIHFFFEFLDGGALRVVELYIISNPSLKTLIAPREGDPVLAFSLPPEAQNLEFQDDVLGGRYLPTADGFGDTVPVRPGDGNYQVMFTYQMPYDHKLELSRPMSLPVEAIVILAPEDGVKIKGENIQDAGTRDVQGISYHMYNGGSLAAGQDLNLTLSGRPSNESLSVGGSAATSLVVGLGAFGIVLIAVGVWLYRRNAMLSEREDEPPEIPLDDAPQNANALMDAILALDDLYQEGELPEEAYLARRAELRARLSELLGS
jgi:cbb3-type cytochrome oxidase subunit 3